MMVYLIRHGQTAGNQKSRYIGGGTDEPLCPEGEAAAKGLGPFDAVKKVYVSPMIRARQTAALLFPKAEQLVCEDLREMNFGDFEDRSADDMEYDAAYRAWIDGMCEAPCPNGESMEGFGERVEKAVSEILEKEWGSDVVIVCHGGTIMAVMRLMAKVWRSELDWLVENCHGYSAQLEKENGRLALSNVQYLDKLEF